MFKKKEEKREISLKMILKGGSLTAFEEIIRETDSSASEVLRDALRLYIALIRAYKDGNKIYMRNNKTKVTEVMHLFMPNRE